MSRFYGTLRGQGKTEATRRGSPNSGITTHAAGWKGAIRVDVTPGPGKDSDEFSVSLVPWRGSGGNSQLLASGILDSTKTRNGPAPYVNPRPRKPRMKITRRGTGTSYKFSPPVSRRAAERMIAARRTVRKNPRAERKVTAAMARKVLRGAYPGAPASRKERRSLARGIIGVGRQRGLLTRNPKSAWCVIAADFGKRRGYLTSHGTFDTDRKLAQKIAKGAVMKLAQRLATKMHKPMVVLGA